MRQFVGRCQRRQLGVRGARLRGEPSDQLMDGGGVPAKVKARPGIGEQAGSAPPVLGRLSVPDRLQHEPVRRIPLRSRAVQSGHFARLGASQLESQ